MADGKLIERNRTHSIIGAFYEVYNTLGFGFLESVYAAALERELVARGHQVAREYAVQVVYKGEPIGFQRIDMLLHFGPEPKFCRALSPRRRNDPQNPDHPALSDSPMEPRPQPGM